VGTGDGGGVCAESLGKALPVGRRLLLW